MVSEEKLVSDGMLVEAREASDEDLLVVHTRRYLNELKVQVGLRAATGRKGCEPGGMGRGGQFSQGSTASRGSIPVPSARGACESVVPKRRREVS